MRGCVGVPLIPQSPPLLNMEEPSPAPIPALLREAEALYTSTDYAAAADRYSQALEALVSAHGDLAPEAADCYYWYGNAMLQKHAQAVENELFGQVLIPAAEEKLDPARSQADDEAGEKADEPEESQEDPGSTVNEVASSVDEENEEDELELIWDNLESARIIYERTLNYPGLLNVYSALGELESSRENYGAAIEELQRAIEIIDAKQNPRRAAELHYRLGLACIANFGSESRAITHFTRSIDLMEGVKTQQPDLVEELEGILSEMRIKLEDAKEQETSLQAVKAESQSLSQQFDVPANPGSEVVDLGVFGKKKLTLTESNAEQPELSAKQTKREATQAEEPTVQKENEAGN